MTCKEDSPLWIIPSIFNLLRRSSALSIFILSGITHCYADEYPGIETVVNHSVPEKSYSLADVRAIFAMRKKYWPDGEKIQVFVLQDDDPFHRQFTKSKLNMFPHQFRRIWDRLIFSGLGHAPTEVETPEEMLEKIETTSGAIGYLKYKNGNTNIRIINYD